MNQNNTTNQPEDQLDLIARTVAGNTEVLDKHSEILDKHTEVLDKHSEILDKHTEQLDRITLTVVGHTDRLDRIEDKLKTFVTKVDHQEIMQALDTIIKLSKKKDEELTMMSHGMQRLRKDVEKMKPLVGLT